VTDVLLTWA